MDKFEECLDVDKAIQERAKDKSVGTVATVRFMNDEGVFHSNGK